jgi:hypothetical protein
MTRFSRVTAGCLLALLSLPIAVASLGAQAPGENGRSVRLRIETDRATYRATDSIAVRIAFTKTGSTPIRHLALPVWRSARLRVSDDSGRVVPTISEPSAFSSTNSIKSTLVPGSTWVRDAGPGGGWTDLRRWGYGTLKPGRYTIEGAPLLADVGVAPDTTLRSNRVTITVTP